MEIAGSYALIALECCGYHRQPEVKRQGNKANKSKSDKGIEELKASSGAPYTAGADLERN